MVDKGKPTPGIPAVEFRDVGLDLDSRRVLAGVSFTLYPGQMMVVTGLSNSGKSLLLRLAIGLHRATEGEVIVEGRSINQLSEPELLRLRSSGMGMAFQEDALFTGLSVYENAAYRLREHNATDAETDAQVMEILRFVGLGSDTGKLPEELSIGMRRRLEIARALVGWPRIALLDEPTSGLDPLSARAVLDLVIRARDLHGMSVLYASKEIDQIKYLASHAIVSGQADRTQEVLCQESLTLLLLADGRVALIGSFNDLETSPLRAAREMMGNAEDAASAESFWTPLWGARRQRIRVGSGRP